MQWGPARERVSFLKLFPKPWLWRFLIFLKSQSEILVHLFLISGTVLYQAVNSVVVKWQELLSISENALLLKQRRSSDILCFTSYRPFFVGIETLSFGPRPLLANLSIRLHSIFYTDDRWPFKSPDKKTTSYYTSSRIFPLSQLC